MDCETRVDITLAPDAFTFQYCLGDCKGFLLKSFANLIEISERTGFDLHLLCVFYPSISIRSGIFPWPPVALCSARSLGLDYDCRP